MSPVKFYMKWRKDDSEAPTPFPCPKTEKAAAEAGDEQVQEQTQETATSPEQVLLDQYEPEPCDEMTVEDAQAHLEEYGAAQCCYATGAGEEMQVNAVCNI